MTYQTLTQALANRFGRPLSKLPHELRAIVAAHIPKWSELSASERRARAEQVDRQQATKFGITCARMQRQLKQAEKDPKYIAEKNVGWYNASLDADMWFGLAGLTPREAAMMLCQLNPQDDNCDPATITTDETGPKDYKCLLRKFEDVEKKEPKARTLRQWLAVARDHGRRYHTWIDKYMQARIEELPADSGSGDDAPKVGGGGTAAENPGIPGKLPRVAIGRLAVTAAWEIECESKRAATADKVIERLQRWATDGKHPDSLLRAEPKKRSVIWIPKKTGREKDYDVGACGKTLDEWRKSRA